jgi:hypothetical protein
VCPYMDIEIGRLFCPEDRSHYDRRHPEVDTDDSIGPFRCRECRSALEWESK